MQVDPNSTDSWFARIDQRLTNQDEDLKEIKEQTKLTNGRVTKLENYQHRIIGWTACAAGVAILIGWAIEAGMHITFSK
jgi:hypothetical protein